MAQWAVSIPADTWAVERLFQHDTVSVPGKGPDTGDEVLLLGGEPARAVALGTVKEVRDDTLLVAYTRRAFDEPLPADGLTLSESVSALEREDYRRVAEALGPGRGRRTWLVSLDLPVEAATPGEAVRQFWSYVLELGPAELPAFVSPYGNELAMQAFVLGEEANLDPEEDED
jgi:hypothetical protein